MRAFRIIHPGISTTIQDLGRSGLMKYGIPPSGAMDQYSYRVGNLLLGNPQGLASLEIALHGLILEAVNSVDVSITGADLEPCLNEKPAPQWTLLGLREGDVLHFKRRKKGFRAYLAISGGFDAPEIMGSRSTFLRGKIGEALKEDGILSIGSGGTRLDKPITFPERYIPDFGNEEPVRVLLGPQERYYTSGGIETFLGSSYKITSQSDRMAYRTDGPPIEVCRDPGIITEPLSRGAIQVPGDGKPIILLRDGQVTGGYAKIGTVISAEMDRLGQMMPGEMIHFQRIEREEAVNLLRKRHRREEEVRDFLAG